MLEIKLKQLETNSHPAHIRRVQHPDQFHTLPVRISIMWPSSYTLLEASAQWT
jgi:hypothetical protein